MQHTFHHLQTNSSRGHQVTRHICICINLEKPKQKPSPNRRNLLMKSAPFWDSVGCADGIFLKLGLFRHKIKMLMYILVSLSNSDSPCKNIHLNLQGLISTPASSTLCCQSSFSYHLSSVWFNALGPWCVPYRFNQLGFSHT